MELSFVLSALKRRFVVVLIGGLLGAIPGLLLTPSDGDVYQSSALLMLAEPTQGTVSFSSGAPDRYVINQLSVMRSASLVDEVAGEVGLKPFEVRDAVTINEEPETDVVEISALHPDPNIAFQITDTYASSYLSTLETQAVDTKETERLAREIEASETRLEEIDDRIRSAMRPFVNSGGTRAVPDSGDIVPSDISKKTIEIQKLSALIQSQERLASDSRLQVNSRLIQTATVPNPNSPLPTGNALLLPGGIIVGLSLGLLAALTWARFSTKVLDSDTVSAVLGAPVVSELPHYRSLNRSPLAAFQSLPRSAVPIIDQLCVRAEAKSQLDQPLTVVVAGTQRGAGATTLALAIAERFASSGSSVVLVDADARDPHITTMFNAKTSGGIPAVIANDGALIDQQGQSVFTKTMDPGVSVLGLGSGGSASFRRETVGSVLEAARRKADVVIIDGGPVLDLASTIQLTELADAVVLGVPLSKQKSDELNDLSRQFGFIRDKLLPVVTAPSKANLKPTTRGMGRSMGLATPAAPGTPQSQSQSQAQFQPQQQQQLVVKNNNVAAQPDEAATHRAEPAAIAIPQHGGTGIADTVANTTEISLQQVQGPQE